MHTVNYAFIHLKNYKYAAVQATKWCFCGNTYGSYGEASNCNQRCAGNAYQICGGNWANSVYEVPDGE